jgi:hypothetical protein
MTDPSALLKRLNAVVSTAPPVKHAQKKKKPTAATRVVVVAGDKKAKKAKKSKTMGLKGITKKKHKKTGRTPHSMALTPAQSHVIMRLLLDSKK